MLRRIPLHPLLVAAFPVLLLWWQNAGEVEPGPAAGVLLRVLLVTLAGTAVVSLVLRDVRRGALVGSAAAFLQLSYAHLWGAERLPVVGLTIWALALLAAVVVVRRLDDEAVPRTTAVVNVVALALVAVPTPGVLLALRPAAAVVEDVPTVITDDGRLLRDIVYIVPDRYGREDNLAATFGIDDSAFIEGLEARGFTVLDETHGNYPRTSHSLASTLSMEYLDALAASVPADASDDLTPVYPMLRDHRVGEILTDAGYRYIHVGSWWSPTATATAADEVRTLDSRPELGAVLADTTATSALQRLLGKGEEGYRERVRAHSAYQLDELARLAAEPADGPRFIMAHITLPHEPYVFDRDGSWVDEETEHARERSENYERQLTYLNGRLDEIVDLYLDRPGPEPVIVIQADEGPHTERQELTMGSAFRWEDATDEELRTKMRVLSALYLPDVDPADLPPQSMSSVNTWRYVLDTYLGTGLGLLEDRAYIYPGNDDYYTFTEVTDRVAGR